MLSLIARWIVNAGALLLVAYLYPGVGVQYFVSALVAATPPEFGPAGSVVVGAGD